ncbi:hypothetical protein JW796_03855 [Candidatus Dojkabacteria bacterium]|nr:hypothetical protein [Candidatus Dojkabacteria bacterium]
MKVDKHVDSTEVENLLKAILKLRNINEAKKFFRDLMTVPEIKSFAGRWKSARMLDEGISYKEIEKETGISSATIARVSQWLNYGMDGYRLVLDRVKKNK